MATRPTLGDTGKTLETQYFGTLKVSAQNMSAFQRAVERLATNKPKPGSLTPFVPFGAAVELTKRFQPWDSPELPGKQVASDLLEAVGSMLRQKGYRNASSELKFYTAVSPSGVGMESPLDLFHGVDAFIEWGTKRVLLDLTRNTSKGFEDSHDNRIVINELPDYGDEKERPAYKKAIAKYAEAIANTLSEKKEPSREVRSRTSYIAPEFR